MGEATPLLTNPSSQQHRLRSYFVAQSISEQDFSLSVRAFLNMNRISFRHFIARATHKFLPPKCLVSVHGELRYSVLISLIAIISCKYPLLSNIFIFTMSIFSLNLLHA